MQKVVKIRDVLDSASTYKLLRKFQEGEMDKIKKAIREGRKKCQTQK